MSRSAPEIVAMLAAKHADHPLRLGEAEIPCYVLDDGRRVLVQRGLQSGIGMSTSGGSSGAHRLAVFLESLAAKGLDLGDLALRIRTPIMFQAPQSRSRPRQRV